MAEKEFYDDDLGEYAKHLKEAHDKRLKLTLVKLGEKKWRLEFLCSRRTEKIVFEGTSCEEVVTAFFKAHSETHFAMEFVSK